MDHSYSDIRSKIIFFQPSDRQNFANALGQTCILDLRLRHTDLNADALHHMKLTSAVEVQNGLKLAGGPGFDL